MIQFLSKTTTISLDQLESLKDREGGREMQTQEAGNEQYCTITTRPSFSAAGIDQRFLVQISDASRLTRIQASFTPVLHKPESMNNIIELLLLYYKIQSKILIGVFSFLSFIYIKFIQSSYLILTSLLIVTSSISLSYNLSVIKFNVESIKKIHV